MVILFWIAIIFAVGVICFVVWKLQKPQNQEEGWLPHNHFDFKHEDTSSTKPVKNTFKTQTANHPAAYSFNIVGEGSYQQNLKKIAGPKEEISKFHECTARITSEPTNKFDKNAVKVEINGLLVGYLSRDHAQKLAGKRINRTVDAVIDGGWDDDIDEGHYGVKLAIKNVSDLI